MRILANLYLAGVLAVAGALADNAGAAVRSGGEASAPRPASADGQRAILVAGKPLSIIPPGATRVRTPRRPVLRVYGATGQLLA